MAGFCVVPASHPFIMKNRARDRTNIGLSGERRVHLPGRAELSGSEHLQTQGRAGFRHCFGPFDPVPFSSGDSGHEIEAQKPHVWISGALDEWETLGRRRPALRLRLQDETPDFRVDIEMFREGMNREIPPGLRQAHR